MLSVYLQFSHLATEDLLIQKFGITVMVLCFAFLLSVYIIGYYKLNQYGMNPSECLTYSVIFSRYVFDIDYLKFYQMKIDSCSSGIIRFLKINYHLIGLLKKFFISLIIFNH